MNIELMNIENAILGSILLEPKLLEKAIEFGLNEIHFTNKINRTIFIEYKKAEKIDPILLENVLNEKELQKIFELMDSVHTTANFEHYVQELINQKIKQEILYICNNAKDDIELNDTETAKNIIISKLEKINNPNSGKVKTYGLEDIYNSFFSELDKEEIPTFDLGFKTIKDVNLEGGDLMIVAGRPGAGKTAYLLNMAFRLGKQGKKGLFFSLEMSAQQIGKRILSILTGVELYKIRDKKGQKYLTEQDFKLLNLASEKIGNYKINVVDTQNPNFDNIKAIAKQEKRKNDIDFIMIDYLQLIRMPNAKNRLEEVTEISLALKSLARQLDVPVIAISQLSRATETRTDKRPLISDLRESGQIEQDASVIQLLYCDDYYKKTEEKAKDGKVIVEVNTAKNRNGKVSVTNLSFNMQTQRFGEFV
jgi:replicative DNA helicase